MLHWFLGVALVYSSLFSIGKLIFRELTQGFVLLGLSALLFAVLAMRLRKNPDA